MQIRVNIIIAIVIGIVQGLIHCVDYCDSRSLKEKSTKAVST